MPWIFLGALMLALAAVSSKKMTNVAAGERWVLIFAWTGAELTPSMVQSAFGSALAQSARILSYDFSGNRFSVDLTYTKAARLGVGQTISLATPSGSAKLTLVVAARVAPLVTVKSGERWKIFISFQPAIGVSGITKDALRAQIESTYAGVANISHVVFGDAAMSFEALYLRDSKVSVGGIVKQALPDGTIAQMVVQNALKVG